jgi:hypothetical protein
VPPDMPVNRRTALLQDLLRGIAELVSGFPASPKPGSGESESRIRSLVLAEEAIRIDPSSISLRTAAAALQRAADAPQTATRSAALAAASAAAAAEARHAQAGAPLASPSIAPALAGAFTDAMRRER